MAAVAVYVNQHPFFAWEPSRPRDAWYGAVKKRSVLSKERVKFVLGVLVTNLEHHTGRPALGGNRSIRDWIWSLELNQDVLIWRVFYRQVR
ncbi:hypothetical protein SMJ63A_100133 [Stenotrophomonas geniculata]